MNGYKAVAVFIIWRAMRDAAGRGMTPTKKSRSVERTLQMISDAESWLCESAQCEQLIEWTGWPWTPEESAHLAKNGELDWIGITHRLTKTYLTSA